MFGRARRMVAFALVGALAFSMVAAALPPASTTLSPGLAAASGEVLASPHFIGVAVMPNSQVGMIFQNSGTEIRFKRYTDEQATDPSLQLSTAAPWYPQLATFGGELVAAYVDTRQPNVGKIAFRVSGDNGVTWGAESYPLGTATFATTIYAPVVVGSRDGQTLYLFSSTGGTIPQYWSTTDPTLTTWTGPSAAGDASMYPAYGSNCGNAGAECYRARG
jgi:hypothetical protein